MLALLLLLTTAHAADRPSVGVAPGAPKTSSVGASLKLRGASGAPMRPLAFPLR